MNIEPNNCYNIDCEIGMQLMKEQELKADWCITDPPYGIGIEKMNFTQSGAKLIGKATRRDYTDIGNWDSERIRGGYLTLFLSVVMNKLYLAATTIQIFLHPQKVG